MLCLSLEMELPTINIYRVIFHTFVLIHREGERGFLKYLDFVQKKKNWILILDLPITLKGCWFTWVFLTFAFVFFVGSSKWPCHVGSMTSQKILLMQGCLNSYHYDYIGSRFLCAQDQNLCLNFAGSWEKDVFRLLSLFLSFFSIISYPHPPSPFISCIKYFFKHKCICREEIEISFKKRRQQLLEYDKLIRIYIYTYVVAKRIDIYIYINK